MEMFCYVLVLVTLYVCICAAVPSLDDRPTCKDGYLGPIPAVRVNTTIRLQNLRELFGENNIDAYIIPTEDAHSSEYVSDYDDRRTYISGFSGSAGSAVVTASKAALWTDGRYFLQAEDELDCNWILMKSGDLGVPSITEWLDSELTNGQSVGANPFVNPTSRWLDSETKLTSSGITLVQTPALIDTIWTTDRPPVPAGPVNVHPLEYAGVSWPEKMGFVRNHLDANNAAALVVTSLDETAWLYNLRGEDIPFNPFFMSYGIVEQDRVRLYLRNYTLKLEEISLRNHLNTNADGSCTEKECVEVKSYDVVKDDVQALGNDSATGQIWVSHYANYAIYGVIPEAKRHHDSSPIALMKSVKNEVEREGMRTSHIRDAVALITFMQKLEKEVIEGKHWTEVSAAAELARYRGLQDLNKGLSFSSISASGSNGAIIHYTPSAETDKAITTSEMYLLDSGGQYLDGTTDVTRTFHFGTPSDYEKEAYTRVLMGSIDLALLIWPAGLYGRDIDVLARAPLFKAGLVYNHGTGHGIGSYLSVHEGPGRITLGYRPEAYEEKLHEGMFFSDEPGYYEDGQFGIRLETIVEIVKAETPYQYKDTRFLGFSPITLVPFEPKLIKQHMLNAEQITWLNDYHKKTMDIVGKRLQDEGLTDAYNWVAERVKPFDKPEFPASAVSQLTWNCFILIAVVVSYIL